MSKRPDLPVLEETLSMVLVDAIATDGNRRPVSERAANELSQSIALNGLDNAITVRTNPDDADAYILVSGAHRLRAHQILGLDYIKANIRNISADQAKSVERDENFFREDLTTVEQILAAGSFLDEWESDHGKIRRGGDRKSEDAKTKMQTLHFDNPDEILSEKTGKSERSIKDLLSIYRHIGVEVLEQLRDSAIADNGVQLKALSKLPEEEQIAISKLINSGDAQSVSEGKAKLSGKEIKVEHPDDIWMRKAIAHWGGGKKRLQDRFLEKIGAMRT